MNEESKLHHGHRERMRERFMSGGAASMSDHEILEMLLYYSIPRSNTNEQAHRLLSRFGTLENVINAEPREIATVSGVGQSSAVLIGLLGATLRRVAQNALGQPKTYDMDAIVQYLQHRYIGETREKIYLLLFDNGMHLLETVALGEGVVNGVMIEPRAIVEPALRLGALAVVLAHNHPGGIAIPSAEDLDTTHRLNTILEHMNITLLEHLIFAGDRYQPILHAATSSEPLAVDRDFYKTYLERHGE